VYTETGTHGSNREGQGIISLLDSTNWLNLSRKKLIGVVKNVGVFAYSRVKNLLTILNPVPITFKFTISI
jgi:hypothetical protein